MNDKIETLLINLEATRREVSELLAVVSQFRDRNQNIQCKNLHEACDKVIDEALGYTTIIVERMQFLRMMNEGKDKKQ